MFKGCKNFLLSNVFTKLFKPINVENLQLFLFKYYEIERPFRFHLKVTNISETIVKVGVLSQFEHMDMA